jgi:hypothetical protein
MPPTDASAAPDFTAQLDLPRLQAQCHGEIQRVLNEHETHLRRSGVLASGAAPPTAGLADWLAGPIIQKVLAAVLAQLKPILTDFIDRLFSQLTNATPTPGPGGGIPAFEAPPSEAQSLPQVETARPAPAAKPAAGSSKPSAS